MSFFRVFPRLFAICFVLGLLSMSAAAQQTEARPRQATQPETTTNTTAAARAKLENDITIVSTAEEADEDDASATFVKGFAAPTTLGHTERSMLSAIEERLGTPYRMGATGPYRYDCS